MKNNELDAIIDDMLQNMNSKVMRNLASYTKLDQPFCPHKFQVFFDKKLSEMHSDLLEFILEGADESYFNREIYKFRDFIRDYLKAKFKQND